MGRLLLTDEQKYPRGTRDYTPPERTFNRWMRFSIGGVSKTALLDSVEAVGCTVGDVLRNTVADASFTTQVFREDIGTIILTAADLGCAQDGILTMSRLLNEGYLAQWSEKHAHQLPANHTVEQLPPEAVLHMRAQWKDGHAGQLFWIPTSWRAGYASPPTIFSIGQSDQGMPWARAGWVRPDSAIGPAVRMVFRLRSLS